MKNLAKVPVTIITGFLGAGKTTLIRQLLQTQSDSRIAVVVNEFGDVGVDGEILKSCLDCSKEEAEQNIVELPNGCICCTVADDFIPTIENLMALEPRPDHIVIETSGLALPKPLLKAFDWPALRSRITVDGVIALADAEAVADQRFAPNPDAVDAQRAADESLDHETPLSELFDDQILAADVVLLTKTDLAGESGTNKAKAFINKMLSSPLPIIEVQDGKIDRRLVLGLGAAVEDDLSARPSHHDNVDDHDHDDFDSFVLPIPAQSDPESLRKLVSDLAQQHGLLRVKGYAAIDGKPLRLLIQGVGARVRVQYDRPWAANEPRSGNLVVIGEHDIMTSSLKKTLEAAFQPVSSPVAASPLPG